ncbi:MAG TPA: signal peptidase I [Candidatus Hydrogenedentes bacterium]|nr:signal peptidase I [Candidatus Hydrogenedentota bacterium]HIJ73374.1 signal peptidase I [Candidatus Hydrogenedentota bacterium]
MARKSQRKRPDQTLGQNVGKKAAKVSLWALLLAPLVFLTGGLTWQNAYEWLKAILFAGALALLIRWPLFEPFKIPSSSMEPTFLGDPRFMRGDRVLVNKFVYGVRFPFNGIRPWFTKASLWYSKRRLWYGTKPQRFEIVVFKSVEKNARHTTLVKRIIGLPGERVHIANGKVYINGHPLALPPDMPAVRYTTDIGRYAILEDDAHSVVPDNCYLLLGDNSGASRDGRVFGWVPNEHLLGRVSCIAWPPSRWRDFTGFSGTWWWRSILVLLGMLLFVRLFLGRSWRVRTEGVGDALANGEHVYINRCAFGLPIPFTRRRAFRGRAPRRGEIVLYYSSATEDMESLPLLGRIAGVPGEQVYLDGGKLHIDGAPVVEPSLAARTFTTVHGAARFGHSKRREYSYVPEDHYFILADDTGDVPDSQTFGWVPYSALVGPASTVWWPVRNLRRVRP